MSHKKEFQLISGFEIKKNLKFQQQKLQIQTIKSEIRNMYFKIEQKSKFHEKNILKK